MTREFVPVWKCNYSMHFHRKFPHPLHSFIGFIVLHLENVMTDD